MLGGKSRVDTQGMSSRHRKICRGLSRPGSTVGYFQKAGPIDPGGSQAYLRAHGRLGRSHAALLLPESLLSISEEALAGCRHEEQ
jgi:hypothetical protein